MSPFGSRRKIAELARAVRELASHLEELEGRIADRAPASEVERLNHAFDMIADQVPRSEIERLNHAFVLIGDLARRSEAEHREIEATQREISDTGSVLSDLTSGLGRVSHDMTWQSERMNRLLEAAEAALSDSPHAERTEHLARRLQSRFDALYHRFESLYRGSRQEIKARLELYLDLLDLEYLREIGPAVDLGAGRGEWVEFLNGLGFDVYGVDANEEMIGAAAELGLEIRVDDILNHLRSLDQNSLGMVSMFHVAEHLEFEVLVSVIRAAFLALANGGALVIETPNPTNLRVGAAGFYLDPTHLKPLHPTLLRFLYAESGFTRITTHYLDQGDQEPALEVPKAMHGDPAGLRLVDFLNQNLLSPLDYVVVGYKP